MKIYVAHSREIDYAKDLYEPLRKSELNNQHEIILPHEAQGWTNSKEILKQCSLVIADVTFPSTGEGIEMGWANLFGARIICIYKKGAKPSSSLKAVSEDFVEYSSSEELIQKLTELIP